MDDILVYLNTSDEHVRHVKMVLNVLKQNQNKIKTEKYRFHVQKITFLGFVIIYKNCWDSWDLLKHDTQIR